MNEARRTSAVARRIRRAARLLTFSMLAVAAGSALKAAPAGAFDFFDGRLAVHGYYEFQLRSIMRDFQPTDGWDVTQMYNILNIEIEADIAPDGFGPFDLVSFYSRVEGRYDCVWEGACGIFPSVETFGNETGRIPKRLSDGRRAGYRSTGNLFNHDRRAFRDIPRDRLPYVNRGRPDGSRVTSPFFNIQGIDTLFDTAGVDGIFGNADDPAPFYFDSILRRDCQFNFRKTKGSQDGVGTQIMGPWNPSCQIRPNGLLRDKPNPLRAKDFSPITGSGGTGALPLRPAPIAAAGTSPRDTPQGVYYPSAALQRAIQKEKFSDFDQNFNQSELEWNRGASQQDEGELKEAYFDIEMFDSRLWLRLGKQTVVWGKTELFRNQDQWNPQDLALASLPSLEESRIGLWAGRAVWHFWDVGPLQDFRAELVFLFDQFEPTDLGRCGEAYTPNPVCNKTFGLFIHGATGFGIAGEIRPDAPYEDIRGFEIGGRLEWRWSRYSFALTDYYGFTDVPYQDTMFRYSRNVDPQSGRPRFGMETGRCKGGGDPACLGPNGALLNHSVNQQLFSMICATSIGLNNLDRTACGQTIFNSRKLAVDNPLSPTVAQAAGTILAGQSASIGGFNGGSVAAILGNFTTRTYNSLAKFPNVRIGTSNPLTTCPSFNFCPTPLVPLALDPNDGPPNTDISLSPFFVPAGLEPFLTDEQEALLGCGKFYGTQCDRDGIDLMNAEASALFQSFPGIEGTFGMDAFSFSTTNAGIAQPGTVGFSGGPACTRFERGREFILPGCRGPGDRDYSINVDGSVTNGEFLSIGTTTAPFARVHPFTGQRFRSEMAVLSWNALMALVGLSSPDEGQAPGEPDFDPDRPFRNDGCSFARPQLCSNVQSFFQITGLQKNTLRAGGNGTFGRRDFAWHGGREIALRYDKRNILGFSMDFAEDLTKSNIGLEFTWENDVNQADNGQLNGNTEVDRFNLTLSVDRPTFINFLNANRTFFINGQLFIRYTDGYQAGFQASGPWSFLGVLSVNTGYFDDRLLPSMTLVYDKRSNSGAVITQLNYRYTAEFSVTVGVALFAGREEPREMALTPTALGNRVGNNAYNDFVENGLSAVRDRDEIFLRIRYTF